MFDNARLVFEHADYPALWLALGNMDALFPYPPSAILMFRVLAVSPTVFAVAWLALTIAGFFLLFRMSVVHERAALKALWPLLAAGALLVGGGPVEWDLRNANCNLIYLGLIVVGDGLLDRKPRLAGTLIGFAVSLASFTRRC